MSERKRTAKNKSGIANCRIDGDAECTRKSQRVLQFAICISQFAILSVLSAPLAAQVTVIEDGENKITTYRMTVSPAPEPEPAFKYRLLKHEDERKAGNAAPFYYRAMLDKDRARKAIQEEHGDTYYDWMHIEDFPLAELPLDTIRKLPDIFGIDDLREATSRSHCDWGWDLRSQRGPELFQFILTEVQEFRGISRMLALKTRLAIAENRYDDAIEFTQMNYQVGRDAATEPYLVCSLVGIAVCGISNLYTLELMAAPDSPNLYWALTEFPKPLIDVRRAMRFELGNGPRIFPLLQEVETTNRSPQEWSRFIGDAWLTLLNNMGPPPAPPEDFPAALRGPEWEAVRAQLLGTAVGLWAYTRAKSELANSGMPAEEVEAMPVGKVITLQASRAYHHTSDEMEKLWYMSFSEMKRREKAIQEELKRDGYLGGQFESKEVIPIASILLPAINAARRAEERLKRDLAAMAVVEALRMHAADSGRLPASLADVTVVPVPPNPATGKEFAYRLEGETAILKLPISDGFNVGKRFEITLRD